MNIPGVVARKVKKQPMSPKAGNANTTAREGRGPPINTYIIKGSKGRSNCAPRLAAIAKIVILTPLERGVENHSNRAQNRPNPFNYISKIDV